jgi:hypothetical protein
MLYSTIVQRDETGLTQIYEAAKELEDLNVLEAILLCRFDIRKVEQTLNLVRMYQARLNNESMELVAFAETFIDEYATDNNKCFHIALKLVRKIGTTITGSMKIFRKYCPTVRKRLEGSNNIVPVLDYSRLTFRQYHSQFFGIEPYCELVKTLLFEQATFFYHLVAVLKVCKDMIRQEQEVRGDYARLKKIFDSSCDKVLKSIKDVKATFGPVKLVPEEELEERRKKARPMREWLSNDYHEHDNNWLRREAYIQRYIVGSRHGLDPEASQFFAHNPEHGALVCKLVDQFDSLGLAIRKTNVDGYDWQYESMDLVYFLKWSGVSYVDEQGKVVNEENEKRFYENYVLKHYKGKIKLPSWQAVCRQRAYCYHELTLKEMQDAFVRHLPQQQETSSEHATNIIYDYQ